MKQRAVVIAGVLLVTVLLFAGVSAKTKITVACRGDLEAEWVEWVAAELGKKNPEIEVEIRPELTGNPAATSEVMIKWMIGGVFPDVFYGTAQNHNYLYEGWMKDLSPFIERDAEEMDLDDFFPGALETWNFGGRQWGVSVTVAPDFFLYNRNFFAEAGLSEPSLDWDSDEWTWDQVIDYSQKLTRRDSEGNVTRWGTQFNIDPDLSRSFGGDWVTKESYEPDGKWEAALDSPQNRRAFGMVVEAVQELQVAPVSGSWPPGIALGEVAGHCTGFWMVRQLKLANTGYSFGVAPTPRGVTRSAVVWNDPWFIGRKQNTPRKHGSLSNWRPAKKGSPGMLRSWEACRRAIQLSSAILLQSLPRHLTLPRRT